MVSEEQLQATGLTERFLNTYRLAGVVRHADVLANNTVLSEDIDSFVYKETNKGKMKNAGLGGWLTFLVDIFWPF